MDKDFLWFKVDTVLLMYREYIFMLFKFVKLKQLNYWIGVIGKQSIHSLTEIGRKTMTISYH